jgi:hypothetical protein
MAAHSPARRALRWLCRAALVLSTLAVSLPPQTGQAQEPPPVDLTLLSQPIWHTPTDPLNLRLRVTNHGITSLEGVLLTLAAHPVASTRSGLHESFEGNAGAIMSAAPLIFDEVVAPGETFVIEVSEPVSILNTLAEIEDGGVYPVTLTLSDREGITQHDSLTTSLILYDEPPEVPLNMSLVLPLNSLPSRGPDDVFADPLGTALSPIEEAIADGGWLNGLLDAFEAEAGELPPLTRTVRVRPRPERDRPARLREIEIPQRGLHLGIAPTPRLIEELNDMADGYRRVVGDETEVVDPEGAPAKAAEASLTRLEDLFGEQGIQPLLVPYSFPDLPTLARQAPERISSEIEEASEVIAGALDTELSGEWLFAPAGRMGTQSLEEIRFADPDLAKHTLFHSDSFTTETEFIEGCPESFASFTCPVSVRTSAGPTVGLVGDAGLQDRFAALIARGEGALDLQRFFAETASIRQETPSIPGRIVQVTMPSLWHPRPLMSRRLLSGLRTAPWLRTVTPEEGIALADPVVRTDEFIQSFGPLINEPDESLFTQIAETEEFLEDFRRMQPPEPLIDRLRRNTLVAESRMWWTSDELLDTASRYLDGTLAEARRQIEQITVGGPSEINLTAREGEIPMVVSNQTGFPTTVRIEVMSRQPDLDLAPTDVEPQTIASEDTFQFTIDATARSSGIFLMEVVVSTPDGSLQLASKEVIIRSTQFNRIALGLTLGALAFLVLFYLLRVMRRRRTEGSP